MSWLGIVTVAGVIAVAVLIWLFVRARSLDQIETLMNKRRSTSKFVSRADYVEGMERIPVAMALTDSEILYESADIQASVELSRVDEVEYDDELATGKDVEDGKVLRLRAHGHMMEFVIDKASVPQWQDNLPGRRPDTAQAM